MAHLKRVTVDTVADLASARVADGDSVETLGYTAANDGGGATFIYDAGSSATADGGFVHNGPGSVGRFLMSDQRIARADQFGCDNTGATDIATAFQKMVDSGADLIVFPAGSYLMGGDVSLANGGKYTIRGEGIEVTRLLMTDSFFTGTTAGINCVGNFCAAFEMSDMTLVGRATQTDSINQAIEIEKCGRCYLHNLAFEDFSTEMIHINNDQYGIVTGTAGETIIKNCRCYQTGAYVAQQFAKVNGGTTFLMTGCDVRHVARGLVVDLVSGQNLDSVICTNNTFAANAKSTKAATMSLGCIWIDNGATLVTTGQIVISGNHFNDNDASGTATLSHEIKIDGFEAAGIGGLVINGNVSIGYTYDSDDNAGEQWIIENAKNIGLVKNTIADGTDGGTAKVSAIYMDTCTQKVVADNVIDGVFSDGLVSNTCTDGLITGNLFLGTYDSGKEIDVVSATRVNLANNYGPAGTVVT